MFGLLEQMRLHVFFEMVRSVEALAATREGTTMQTLVFVHGFDVPAQTFLCVGRETAIVRPRAHESFVMRSGLKSVVQNVRVSKSRGFRVSRWNRHFLTFCSVAAVRLRTR